MVNGVRQIQALIDKKKLIITETSIRSDLHLEDAGGTDCLPTATIFEELAQMGYEKPSQKLTFYKAFFSLQWKYLIHTITQCLSAKSTAWNEFSSTMTSLIICLATNQRFNLSKYIFDAMVKHLDGGVKFLISQKKQSRRKQRKDIAVTQEETQQDDSVPSLSNDLPLSEKEKDAHAKEIADLKKRVQRLERTKKSRTTGLKRLKKVGISRRVESTKDQESLVDDTHERSDDADMFDIDDLHGDEVNVDMPVGDNQEQSAKEKEVDTSVEDKEERLARKQEEEANIALIESWDNTQAMMKAKFWLAQRSTEEQGESKSYEEIQKMFGNEMRRVNTFISMDSEVVKSKIGTEESSKGADDELEADKSKKEESSEEKAKGSKKKMLGRKRAGKEQQQESSKRQRMEDDKETDEHEEVEEDDEAELKKHLVIVKDDEIAIDAIPLATKPPVIVEYKLLKEGIMVHYQLIRADGSSKRYSSMIRMLQDIDREDLETLWKLVKTKHGDTRPEDEHERVLWGDLKVMFEPDIKSDVWRNLQGYTVTVWKLYDSCGVHFVRFGNVHIFMLVEKRYPLTPITITNMLNKKLQTDHFNEMCYQLLKLMIQKMNIKFRGGLLGLKRLQGFLELLLLSTAGTKVYAAGLQLLEDLLLSRG
ncbi:hypothetical protein Tco_1534088 [Tanacetum coccineum]